MRKKNEMKFWLLEVIGSRCSDRGVPSGIDGLSITSLPHI